MCRHKGGPRDKANMDSEPGKARKLATGSLEEMPHMSDSNYHQDVALSEPAHLCLFTHTLFSPNKLYLSHSFLSLREFISTKAKGKGPCHWPLVPGGLVVRIQHSNSCTLTSISGWELKSCFKPLRATGDDNRPGLTVGSVLLWA